MKVILFDIEGHYLRECDSIQECADIIKSTYNTVSSCVTGARLSVNGFQVRKSLSINIKRIGDISGANGKLIPVAKFWDGRLIAVYSSMGEAALKCGLDRGNISGAVNNGWKHKGFEFKEVK